MSIYRVPGLVVAGHWVCSGPPDGYLGAVTVHVALGHDANKELETTKEKLPLVDKMLSAVTRSACN